MMLQIHTRCSGCGAEAVSEIEPGASMSWGPCSRCPGATRLLLDASSQVVGVIGFVAASIDTAKAGETAA